MRTLHLARVDPRRAARLAAILSLLYLGFAPAAHALLGGTSVEGALDHGESFSLRLAADRSGTLKIQLADQLSTRDSQRLLRVLGKGLSATVGGVAVRIDTSGSSVLPPELAARAGSIEVVVQLYGRVVGTYALSPRTGRLVTKQTTRLSAFELRQFAQQQRRFIPIWNRPVGERQAISRLRPMADLHTHFGGAMRAETILSVAEANGQLYPAALLHELDVRFDAKDLIAGADGKPHLLISTKTLVATEWNKLREALSLDPTRVATFTDMERVYKYRTPFVKNVSSFGAYLKELALDYDKSGVRYAELSVSDILKPEWLAEAHRVLPELEKTHKVKIRFIAALWRHSDPLYNDDLVEKVKAVKSSPYVVGVDFMGHETNSPRSFADAIKKFAEYRTEQNPEFQIRVHAGENPLFPENVREAIAAGATRIGHGLYGMDAETQKLAKEKGVIVEFNLNSNLALNNIRGTAQVPIKSYIDAGIRVSLGTDGHGLYRTTLASEADVAMQAGLTAEDLAKIGASDAEHIAKMERRFTIRRRLPDALSVPTQMPSPRFTPEYAKLSDRLRIEKATTFSAEMNNKGIKTLASWKAAGEAFAGRTPILFSGASAKSWKLISPANQVEVVASVRHLLEQLDPKKTVILTGATDFGVEKVVHDEARKLGFDILGTPVAETNPAEVGAISHSVLAGDTWYEKSAPVLTFVKANRGKVIFIGGGNILNDEIQAAKNFGVDFHLMRGPEGAAHDASAVFPTRSFKGKAGLLNVFKNDRRLDVLLGKRTAKLRGNAQRAQVRSASLR